MSGRNWPRPFQRNSPSAKGPTEEKRPWPIKTLFAIAIFSWGVIQIVVNKYSGESATVIAKHEAVKAIVASNVGLKPFEIRIFETPDTREWKLETIFTAYNTTAFDVGFSVESIKLEFGHGLQKLPVFKIKKFGTIPGNKSIKDTFEVDFAGFPGGKFSELYHQLNGYIKYTIGGEQKVYTYKIDSSIYKAQSFSAARKGSLKTPPNITKAQKDSIVREDVFGGQAFRTDSVLYKGIYYRYNFSPPEMWISWTVEKDCVKPKWEGTHKNPYEDEIKDYLGNLRYVVCPETDPKSRLESTYEHEGARALFQSPYVDKYQSMYEYTFPNN